MHEYCYLTQAYGYVICIDVLTSMTLFTKIDTFSSVSTMALSKGRSPSLPYFSSSLIVSTMGTAYILYNKTKERRKKNTRNWNIIVFLHIHLNRLC